MATLCLFQTNLPFPSSCKLYRAQFCRLHLHNQNWTSDTLTRLKRLHISASSINKPRISRNRRVVKSNEELCNEIRLFLDQVGLPRDHIPSTKDLMLHGRNDLANIVRRRGYKLIRELLESSVKVDVSVVDTDKKLDGVDAQQKIDDDNVKKIDEDATSEITCEMVPQDSDHHEILKDQDEKINVVTEENAFSVQITKADGNLDGSEKVLELDGCNPSYEQLEDLDSSYHDENTSGGPECDDQEVEVSLSSIVPLRGESSYLLYSSTHLQPYTEDSEQTKLTAGSSLEQQFSSKSEGLDARDDAGSEDKPSNTEISFVEDISHSLVMGSINKSGSEEIAGMNSVADLSLAEKVAKFVQDGNLDALEGYELIEAEDVDISSKVSGGEQSKKQFSDDVLIRLNGSISSSRHPVPYAKANNVVKDNKVAAEGHHSNSDKDLDIEAIKQQEEQQISHLKLMLHEKELEFSRLKELIEKEKLALSVLQTVAETEINKAQKLVSEKDAELHAAEESLSGLTEVQIQFRGDGDIVELTGSFNGWHHRIKMDLEPSAASVTDPSSSRKSKLWSVVLWLYPGVYEIKFIVDGDWRTDPQRESVSRGHICNNILRVER